jgi:hypothetical protein
MDMDFSGRDTDNVTVRVAEWRAASIARSWRHPSDWNVSETWLLAGSDDEQQVVAAAARLGRARAAQGIGVLESMRDLMVFFELGEAGIAPEESLIAFAEGWIESYSAGIIGSTATDPVSGLQTEGYLHSRLAEVYAQCRLGGVNPEAAHTLIFIDTRDLEREMRSLGGSRALIGRILMTEFCDGETTAVLPPNWFVVLASAGAGLDDKVHRLRGLLTNMTSRFCGSKWPAPRVELVPMPASLADAMEAVASVRWNSEIGAS